jgi:Stress responsive A/B Barrel Domain
VIRNVVVGRVRPGTPVEDVEAALQALRDLRVEGVTIRMVAGLDAGLREGNASYAITADLDDEQAYRAYDADAEHNRIRREMFAPISEHIERVQFHVRS